MFIFHMELLDEINIDIAHNDFASMNVRRKFKITYITYLLLILILKACKCLLVTFSIYRLLF